MRILIVWGWIDSSDLSLASDQLNVRPRLRPNQLRGSGIPWFIVWAKSGLICPSYEGGQIARESIYPSICSWRCLLQSVCQFWLLFLSLCSLSGPPISFSCRVLYLFCLSLIVMFSRSCNPLSLYSLVRWEPITQRCWSSALALFALLARGVKLLGMYSSVCLL